VGKFDKTMKMKEKFYFLTKKLKVKPTLADFHQLELESSSFSKTFPRTFLESHDVKAKPTIRLKTKNFIVTASSTCQLQMVEG
jgi:hypothetical protein